ncbi:hypothetical protein B0H11DRAFT_2236606 [Mycena galericulata]|nr:hypothetical protein B0H11DRAFT_2236606 [Mycena galericulata]
MLLLAVSLQLPCGCPPVPFMPGFNSSHRCVRHHLILIALLAYSLSPRPLPRLLVRRPILRPTARCPRPDARYPHLMADAHRPCPLLSTDARRSRPLPRCPTPTLPTPASPTCHPFPVVGVLAPLTSSHPLRAPSPFHPYRTRIACVPVSLPPAAPTPAAPARRPKLQPASPPLPPAAPLPTPQRPLLPPLPARCSRRFPPATPPLPPAAPLLPLATRRLCSLYCPGSLAMLPPGCSAPCAGLTLLRLCSCSRPRPPHVALLW